MNYYFSNVDNDYYIYFNNNVIWTIHYYNVFLFFFLGVTVFSGLLNRAARCPPLLLPLRFLWFSFVLLFVSLLLWFCFCQPFSHFGFLSLSSPLLSCLPLTLLLLLLSISSHSTQSSCCFCCMYFLLSLFSILHTLLFGPFPFSWFCFSPLLQSLLLVLLAVCH